MGNAFVAEVPFLGKHEKMEKSCKCGDSRKALGARYYLICRGNQV